VVCSHSRSRSHSHLHSHSHSLEAGVCQEKRALSVGIRRSNRRNSLGVLTLCMRTPSCTPTLSSQLLQVPLLSRPGTFTTASLGGATSLNSLSPPLPAESDAGSSRPACAPLPPPPPPVGLLDVTSIRGGLNDLRAAVRMTAWGNSASEIEPAEDERGYPAGRRTVVGGFGSGW
jgi:hypothetical protein